MTNPASVALHQLANDYWETTLEDSPLLATSLGDRRYDDRLPDRSSAGLARLADRRRALVERSDAIDATGLVQDDRVTLTALREELAAELAELDAGLERWSVDPLDGLPAGLLSIPEYQRLETPDDGRRMLLRWAAMGPFVDTHIDSLRTSLRDGLVAARSPVSRVRGQLERLLATATVEWALVGPAAAVDELPGWSDTERGRFRTALTDTVEGTVRPALTRLHRLLVDEIEPAARGDDRPGLAALPGGSGSYAGMIRRHTSLDVPAEEFHRTGLQEIARIDEELRELAGRVLGTNTLDAAIQQLRSDPALYFGTRDEVEATAVACLARANGAVPGWFGRLPETPCVVVRMSPHEEPDSTIAYYRNPALDGSRPGQYFINTSAPETRPRYEAEALAFHEAVPGHHTQIALSQELTDVPSFRKHLGPTAFVEGWGLYTERLCDEMGLYSGDLDRIGVLSYDAWRASRLVVDTGMHALGWSRDQAIAFMTAHSALAPNNIANEVDRYIVWPGQALAYKTGQSELLRLRADAQARMGARFDIRTFHDTVLGQGALPLSALREVVDRWITRPAAAD